MEENREGKEPLYAFWSYDRPPYVLSGKILDFHPSGGVYVEGYDENRTSYFTRESILAILPESKAKEYQNSLKIAMAIYQALLRNGEEQLREVKDRIRNSRENQAPLFLGKEGNA